MTSDKITDLESEVMSLVRTLDDIKKLLSLGKSKEIADEIERVMNYYNYNK
jgi:soluble cytochrome b562